MRKPIAGSLQNHIHKSFHIIFKFMSTIHFYSTFIHQNLMNVNRPNLTKKVSAFLYGPDQPRDRENVFCHIIK